MKLKLVDIAGLSPADGLIELPESSLWFWNYEVWRFKSHNPASPIAAIGWKFILPNGKWSTDKKYSVLLDSIKNVAYGMLSNKSYGKSLSVGTLGSIGVGLRELFKWLISKRLFSLAELTPARIKQYRSNLRDILLDRNAFYGSPSVSVIAANETVEEENLYEIYEVELAARFNRRDYTALDSKPAQSDSSPVRNGVSRKKTTGLTGECRIQGEDDAISDARDAEEAEEHLADGGFSYAQVSYRLLALLYCHAQRKLLLSKRLPIMPNEPYPKEDIGQLTRQLAKFIVNRIPAVPDLVANRILSSVLEWIDVYGPAFEDVLRNYSELRRLGREDPKATVDYSELIKRFDSKIPVLSTTTEIAWREPRFEGEETLPEAVPDIHHRMRLAALFVRDACSLAIQFLAGLRVSEICSTKAEAEKNKDMAGCIELKSSHHGLFNLFSIAGVTIKGRQRPLATQWIVGGTPKGSNELPVIVKAVNLLHKITYILQPKAKQTALFWNFRNTNGFPNDPEMIVPADGVAIARGIRRFIRCFVELGDLPDRDSDGVSLVTYRDSKGQCIKTHQGRKTFAAYCLSSKRSSLAAVSNHFKHVSEGITLEGYYPPALRMKTEVEAFRFAATIDYFSDIIDGRRVFGRMKAVIEKFIADEGFRDIEDMVERREAIEGYLRLHKISVFFADNGSCLIAARPMDARCRKETSGVGWAHLEPDYISRHASMCSGCQCFAYDSSHREYWERRKDDAYLASRDASNRVAVERYKTATTFLKVLAAKEAA